MSAGDYELLRALNDAGVYEARDPSGNPCVLTRVVLPSVEECDLLAARLARLAHIRHRHLVAVLDVCRNSPTELFVITEALHAVSLTTILQVRHHLEDAEVAMLWEALGSALAALHERGVIHGDISPTNVMITDAGEVVLIDLCARLTLEAGTPGYIAPEREAGAAASTASDLWGLGALLRTASTNPVVKAATCAIMDPNPNARVNARDFVARRAQFCAPAAIKLPRPELLAVARMQQRAPATRIRPQRRRRQQRRMPLAAFAAYGLIGLIAVVGMWWIFRPAPLESSPPHAIETASHPYASALTELLHTRDTALTSGDDGLLASVYHPTSQALAQDQQMLAQWHAEHRTISNLQTTVSDITVIGPHVRAWVQASAYTSTIGQASEQIGASQAQCRIFTVIANRIATISRCPDSDAQKRHWAAAKWQPPSVIE
ncbi:MAG: protein kinase [Bowdeniella nasicola]|nr:protein kinase [Bowdeniella nasicola]